MNRKIVLDALHLVPTLLEAIHYNNGSYLIGLKDNQPHLRRLCFVQTMLQAPGQERVDTPKRGHGRIEERTYACFLISGLLKAARWQKAGLTTLVRVDRVRRSLAGVELSRRVSYFVSNVAVEGTEEAGALYDAIRGHCRAAVAGH